MIKNSIYTLIVLIAGAFVAGILYFSPLDHGMENTHDETHGAESKEEEAGKGPHGGRLLQQGEFALELKIFEKGVPPEFHVYSFFSDQAISPDDVDLVIKLARLDGQVDTFNFKPQQDYLRGDGVVTEPHSFDVTVSANYQGKTYEWQYDNYEGRVQISENIAAEAGIRTEKVVARKIKDVLSLTGRVQVDPTRLSQVRARFPGLITQVKRGLGDVVRQGDVLAEIQSNESLQNYTLKAPISGVILRRDVQVGEATGNEPLFLIADLSKVWVELDIFEKDLKAIRTGQSVSIKTLSGEMLKGKIDWLSPVVSHASQSIQARVILPNANDTLRPGQFVQGRITTAEHSVPLAVRKSGIQGFRDFQVVFARFGDTYEVRMLELGRSDDEWVEVLDGLKPGTEYVTKNSYLIKADIEKSGASHDH